MTDYTSLETLKGSLSHLPDDELNSIVTAVQKEQDARKNKKRQELINKAVAALHDLQAECGFDGCLIIGCDNCGDEMCLTLDEIAKKIQYEIG